MLDAETAHALDRIKRVHPDGGTVDFGGPLAAPL